MGDMIEFRRADGKVVPGYLAETRHPKGSVVLIHEWWGLRDEMKRVADRLAIEAGYTTLVPDLYRGVIANDAATAQATMQKMDWSSAVDDVLGAAAHLKSTLGGKVATLGFCMGGGLSLHAGMRAEGAIDAVITFYGLPPKEAGDPALLKCPLQGHWASNDNWVTPERIDAVKQRCILGKVSYEGNQYQSGHGFFNDARPEVYDYFEAKIAWERVVTFLNTNLAGITPQ